MMTPNEPEMSTSPLDESIGKALASIRSAGTPDPDVLLFTSTGARGLVSALEDGVKLDLADVEGTPGTFRTGSLFAGRMGTTAVWIVEDAPRRGEAHAPWTRAFPIWIAASAGAQFVIHTSAGTALRADPRTGTQDDALNLEAESLVRVTDHINLSGITPLLGVGNSRLGPLFPDQTRVHDRALGELAERIASEEGTGLARAVAACTLGPALSTPAELQSYALAGAGVAVQRLADPLIAAAHAGLGVIALTAVTDVAGENLAMASIVQRAARVAPGLDALSVRIAREAGPLVATRREEAPA
jgi:purine nucleoside phosphorylase